ncbi:MULTISPECIES: hypothetical protein [unclassified Streptomyces]|uniref:hypothetical protein n=1 Tax=unclassified Streptomyces TaxID=2593676 RepID=UPI000DAE8BFE|nr:MULTISPECIES: hypothetical protein [unclassified Streptomyces]PZT71993.1 hypothetical protein DNK55_25665 [Streptomyces sp. AC1-42T]PZT81683.1 hypothetical protein DNK56_05900 [Streptomyces sp. AC1-42W]
MPRPTAAQLVYGSVTVVFADLAMLLLFQVGSGVGIAVAGTAALALGLAVSVTVPTGHRRHTARSAEPAGAAPVPAPRRSAAATEGRAPVSAQSHR